MFPGKILLVAVLVVLSQATDFTLMVRGRSTQCFYE